MILTTKGIDDTALKYFVEAGAIACRRVPKDDLRCAWGQRGNMESTRAMAGEWGWKFEQRAAGVDAVDGCRSSLPRIALHRLSAPGG